MGLDYNEFAFNFVDLVINNMENTNNTFVGKNLVTDTHVYFYTNYMSNWNICKFIDPISGVSFDNTEQAFMWYKADFFKDIETRTKLEKQITPMEAKHLGREVKNYNDAAWECVRYGYMVYVNYLKYTQNDDLKQKLLSTNNKILVEASKTDNIWGVGLAANDSRILDEKNWTGGNLLGKSLMDVRKMI